MRLLIVGVGLLLYRRYEPYIEVSAKLECSSGGRCTLRYTIKTTDWLLSCMRIKKSYIKKEIQPTLPTFWQQKIRTHINFLRQFI